MADSERVDMYTQLRGKIEENGETWESLQNLVIQEGDKAPLEHTPREAIDTLSRYECKNMGTQEPVLPAYGLEPKLTLYAYTPNNVYFTDMGIANRRNFKFIRSVPRNSVKVHTE